MSVSEQREQARRAWVTPRLTVVGNVAEVVRGGGKSGATFDSDPTNTVKSGTG